MKIFRTIKKSSVSLCGIVNPFEAYGITAIPGAIRIKPYHEGDVAHLVKAFKYPGNAQLTVEILRIAGFQNGTEVKSIKGEDCFILFSSEYNGCGAPEEFDEAVNIPYKCPEESEGFIAAAQKAKYTVVSPNSSGLLRIKEALEAINAKKKDCLAGKLFAKESRYWLELCELRGDDGILMDTKNIRSISTVVAYSEMTGAAFSAKINNWNFHLPKAFANLSEIDKYPVWVDESRKTIVIELPIGECCVCGDVVRSTLPHKTAHVCPHCRELLGRGNEMHNLFEAVSVLEKSEAVFKKGCKSTGRKKSHKTKIIDINDAKKK